MVWVYTIYKTVYKNTVVVFKKKLSNFEEFFGDKINFM